MKTNNIMEKSMEFVRKPFTFFSRDSKKRGLSPVIASVLMIMLVLVLAAMIFLWARGFISEQIEKFGRPVEELCASVDFRVEVVNDNTGKISELEILNRGNVDIRHLDIKMTKGGNSEVAKFDFAVDSGKAVKKGITLEMEDGVVPDEIVVYPALVGNVHGKTSNKVFTCVDVGKSIQF